MSYLLDTNIVSETIRKDPNRSVIKWLDQIPGEALFIRVLTLGEIRKGIETLGDQRRRENLCLWLEHELPTWFEGRVLPVNFAVADRWVACLHRQANLFPPLIVFWLQQLCIMNCAWLHATPWILIIMASN